jgi:hypothetical protein
LSRHVARHLAGIAAVFYDRLGPAPDSAAERMFNQPLSLKNFDLVYAADAYRVFRVK